MAGNKWPVKQYQFTPNIDLSGALDTLEIEHLEVTKSRTIAIYTRTILNIEAANGQLCDAQIVNIEVLDDSQRSDDPTDLLETVVDRIRSVTESNYREIP